jgi:hypothetical protein
METSSLKAVICAEDGIALLGFPWDARHETTGQPLREWVKTLPERKWDAVGRRWMVGLGGLEPGALKRAGFVAVWPDGTPAKRSGLTSRPLPAPPPASQLKIPDWFGLALDGYQVDGAIAVASGHWMLADAPGVGKTRQALAAAAALGSLRTLILCPPTVISHWTRETIASGVATRSEGGSPTPASAPLDTALSVGDPRATGSIGEVVAITRQRREIELPQSGVVIASDATVTARPHLADALKRWDPDVFILDEAHRAKTWESKRSMTMRSLARSSSVTIPVSGTPLFANPVELTPLLDMTGHLDTVFGGRHRFIERYARQNRYGGWTAKKHRLPELRRILDEHVWVLRTKDDVLPHLPPKARRASIVDVDTHIFSAAHAEVIAKIDDWIASFVNAHGDLPGNDDVDKWSRGNVSCVSQLRKAAGIAKVPAAVEMISEWVASQAAVADYSSGSPTIRNPLVVWTHHRVVMQALADAATAAARKAAGSGIHRPCAVISGDTPNAERTKIVDEFQAGEIPVLICSIAAAGVGITLTRSSDVIFVETDWTPALVSQAEDRCHRIGQENHVTITTLIAPKTLDERIQQVLRHKAEMLDTMLGGDNAVYVDDESGPAGAHILTEMVLARLRSAVIPGRSVA